MNIGGHWTPLDIPPFEEQKQNESKAKAKHKRNEDEPLARRMQHKNNTNAKQNEGFMRPQKSRS